MGKTLLLKIEIFAEILTVYEDFLSQKLNTIGEISGSVLEKFTLNKIQP